MLKLQCDIQLGFNWIGLLLVYGSRVVVPKTIKVEYLGERETMNLVRDQVLKKHPLAEEKYPLCDESMLLYNTFYIESMGNSGFRGKAQKVIDTLTWMLDVSTSHDLFVISHSRRYDDGR